MKIVLTRLDRVGDLILSTPAIASVRRSWPQAHVTIVCSRLNAAVMERHPDVDRVIVAPSPRSAAAIGRDFRGQCDLAIALAPCVPDFQLVGATRAAVRVGYTYRRRYLARATSWLFVNRFTVDDADPLLADRFPDRPVAHEVDQVLELLPIAGGTPSYRDVVVPIDDVDRHAVDHVPPGCIAFHLGLRWCYGGATIDSAIQAIAELRTLGRPVVVTYGIEALEAAAKVREAHAADAVVGGLSFRQWAAAFEKSALVVTVDTGATHVASAMRRPTVVLFEHRYYRLSSQEWAPYRVPSVSLRKPAGESPEELASTRAQILEAARRLLSDAT
ncbi:MAG: glycosyltransferase family 9 protein [Candidatus Eremiobacteraeota bacterium]|nr:glycosyltransferase family 9 protein [Candidatus Eremiobacteraeota bacterium]